ncbi:MAG: hypothetical protein IMX03_00810 [Brockia lithotrophica]|nr:hypothetical protein [Brockia lithotrophica]
MDFKITPADWLVNIFSIFLSLFFGGLISYAILKLINELVNNLADSKIKTESLMGKFFSLLLSFSVIFLTLMPVLGAIITAKDAFLTIYDLLTKKYGVVVEDTPKNVEIRRFCSRSGCQDLFIFTFESGKEYAFKEKELTPQEIKIVKSGKKYIAKIFSTEHGGLQKIKIEFDD